MRLALSLIVLLCLCAGVPGARSDDAQGATGHHAEHASHSHSAAAATPPSFASVECPAQDASAGADKIALGIIERCADIELVPNTGGFKLATYLLIDAPRAQGKPLNGITVETAPGRATFTIPDRVELEGYAICNLDRTIRSEVPRNGRFKPKHGWTYDDARKASYQWDVKERVAGGATAPHLRVWAYFVAIPSKNLAQGIERKWCRGSDELRSLKRE